jgi:hypothetical protein
MKVVAKDVQKRAEVVVTLEYRLQSMAFVKIIHEGHFCLL